MVHEPALLEERGVLEIHALVRGVPGLRRQDVDLLHGERHVAALLVWEAHPVPDVVGLHPEDEDQALEELPEHAPKDEGETQKGRWQGDADGPEDPRGEEEPQEDARGDGNLDGCEHIAEYEPDGRVVLHRGRDHVETLKGPAHGLHELLLCNACPTLQALAPAATCGEEPPGTLGVLRGHGMAQVAAQEPRARDIQRLPAAPAVQRLRVGGRALAARTGAPEEPREDLPRLLLDLCAAAVQLHHEHGGGGRAEARRGRRGAGQRVAPPPASGLRQTAVLEAEGRFQHLGGVALECVRLANVWQHR
mmetsp:Transcript_100297/g.312509  ORF Transcript_100297/g.312509 Transcript_100297/m.312509 type:complete len:306 (-) Transcript_100297:935-1852(-)